MKKLHVRQYGNQYSYGTGIKDKTGAEIFEGDIVLFEPDEEGYTTEYGKVLWHEAKFVIKWDGVKMYDDVDNCCSKMIRVVGSKYKQQTA